MVHKDLAQEPNQRIALGPRRPPPRLSGGTVCLPLRDATRTFGLLVLYNAELKQTSDEELTLLREMADDVALGVVSLRTQAEARRLQAAVDKVAAAVSAFTGAEFFEQLANKMAGGIEATGGFVTQLLVGDPLMGRTIAAVVDGKVMENFSYAVEGTPCENLLTSDTWVVAKRWSRNIPTLRCWLSWVRRDAWGEDSTIRQDKHWATCLWSSATNQGSRIHQFDPPDLRVPRRWRIGAATNRRANPRASGAHRRDARGDSGPKDLDGSILLWNKGAERTYGWTSDEVVGRKAAGWLYRDPTEFQIAQAEILVRGEWGGGNHRKRTKDGRDLSDASR